MSTTGNDAPSASMKGAPSMSMAEANAALTAYRSQGLMLERSFPLDGWFTPVMVAASG